MDGQTIIEGDMADGQTILHAHIKTTNFSVAIATLGTSNVRPFVCLFVCKQVV